MPVSNDIRVFPASNTGDWGRIFSEKNMKSILGFIASTRAVIQGFNVSMTSLIDTNNLACNMMSGQAIFDGYQVDCFNEQYVVPFPDSFYPNGRTEPMVLPSEATFYICLRVKFRIATEANDDTTFIDYRDFGDMPDGYKTCPFVIVPAPTQTGVLEDTIPDVVNPSYDTGFKYSYLPLYKLIFRDTVLHAEDVLDIRNRAFINLDKITIGYKGDNTDDYFGFDNTTTDEKVSDWRIKYILSNGGQIDSAERLIYQYICFIHSVVRGYSTSNGLSSLEIIEPTDETKASMFDQNAEELPIINQVSPEDSIVRRLKYYIGEKTEENRDFINNRIILPEITQDDEGNITCTYKSDIEAAEGEYGYALGHIVTIDNELLVNRTFLPKATTTNTGIIQIAEEFQKDTEESYTNTNTFDLSDTSILRTLSPRYSIAHIKVKALENEDASNIDILDNDSSFEFDAGTNIQILSNTSTRTNPILNIAVYGTVSAAYGIQYDPDIDPSTYPGNEGKTFYFLNQDLLKTSDVEFNSVTTPLIKHPEKITIQTPELEINSNVTINAADETKPGLTVVGTITANKVYEAVYNDYAEWFLKEDIDIEVEPGDIISKIPGCKCYNKSEKSYDNMVVGVYSDSYGTILGGEKLKNMEDNIKHYIPVGIAGRVMVKVIGPIMEGDLIVTSTVPGVGMKMKDYIPGTVIGKALETKDSLDIGKVEMLIMVI